MMNFSPVCCTYWNHAVSSVTSIMDRLISGHQILVFCHRTQTPKLLSDNCGWTFGLRNDCWHLVRVLDESRWPVLHCSYIKLVRVSPKKPSLSDELDMRWAGAFMVTLRRVGRPVVPAGLFLWYWETWRNWAVITQQTVTSQSLNVSRQNHGVRKSSVLKWCSTTFSMGCQIAWWSLLQSVICNTIWCSHVFHVWVS